MIKANRETVISYTTAYPNTGAAISAAVLFFVLSFFTIYHTRRTRAWFVLFAYLTCILECVGYIFRYLMIYSPKDNTFIITQCMLIITPVFTTLVDYVAVGRFLNGGDFTKDPRLRFMRPSWIARIFTLSDIFCLLLQGGGASMLVSNDPKQIMTGTRILRAGLFLQIAIFTMFAVFALFVYLSPALNYCGNPVLRPAFIVLGSTIVMLQVRTIFRAVEFMLGFDGYLNQHEAFLYCFDFMLVFICCVLFTFIHFGDYLNIIDNRPALSTGAVDDTENPSVTMDPVQTFDNAGNSNKIHALNQDQIMESRDYAVDATTQGERK